MTLVELKKSLLEKKLDTSFFIFKVAENTFLANQYLTAICDQLQLEPTSSESIVNTQSALSLVMNFENNLNVVRVDTFSEFVEDYSSITNTIVICYKIDKKIESEVKEYIVEFPKLEEWQVLAYMQTLCPELTSTDFEWLYKMTRGDIYRIKNELDKVVIFEPPLRRKVFTALRNDPNSDLYILDDFKFTDAFLKRDLACVWEYLQHRGHCKVEIFSVVNSALAKARKLLLARYGGKTKEELGLTPQYYNRLKNNPHEDIPVARLEYLISVLSAIDLQIKSGELDLSKEAQLDYLMTEVFL